MAANLNFGCSIFYRSYQNGNGSWVIILSLPFLYAKTIWKWKENGDPRSVTFLLRGGRGVLLKLNDKRIWAKNEVTGGKKSMKVRPSSG